MMLLSTLRVLLFLVPLAIAAPTEIVEPLHRRACATLHVRKEWRDLTLTERADYIKGVKCLQTLPATVKGRRGVVTRFDEFQSAHVDLEKVAHQVGQFLVWHRHHLTLYAQAMRNECGYTGPATYWDWTRDADSTGGGIRASPIFSPTTGFGGDGVGTSRCVADGPFADMIVRLGPGTQVGDHCLTRRINEGTRSSITSAAVARTMAETTFEAFRTTLENRGIHGGGHGAIGGEAVNPISSPGDPLFYLHHGNLDRVWWKWQIANRTSRMNAVSGRTTQTPPYTQLTFDHVLNFTSLTAPLPVRDIMNLEAEPACSTYFD